MKIIMLLFSVGFLLTGCGKFADGTSVFAEGLWIVPTLTGLGSLICFIKAFAASKSGSKQQVPGRGTVYSDKNVPVTQIGWFWVGVALAAITFGIIYGVNRSA